MGMIYRSDVLLFRVSAFLCGWTLLAMAPLDTVAGTVTYNVADYGSSLATRECTPPIWRPDTNVIPYQGHLEAHWQSQLSSNHDSVTVSRADALASGLPADFNLKVAPDNCWGMFMNFGLIHLSETANLTITLAADASQGSVLQPAFALYQGWDTSSTATRHNVIHFGTNDPLGTHGLEFIADAYAGNLDNRVTQTFNSLEPGRYELFVTTRTNQGREGAYTVTLETGPPTPGALSPLPDYLKNLCGPANNGPALPKPELSTQCRWGNPLSQAVELADGRSSWYCADPASSTQKARCYTLGRQAKANQDPLYFDSTRVALSAGSRVEMALTGGNGPGRLSLRVSSYPGKQVCKANLKGNVLTVIGKRKGTCTMTATRGSSKQYYTVQTVPLSVRVQ